MLRCAGSQTNTRVSVSDDMPFVKLDCGILDSTLWLDRLARELFVTALLMAEPFEAPESIEQIAVRSLDLTGWLVPPGWYGFIHAAGVGILSRAGMRDEDFEKGYDALERLGAPDLTSRSAEFDGRRLVRVNGGYIALNYIKYREKDATSADRSRRWRERRKLRSATRVTDTPTRVIRHQAEAEVQVEAVRTTRSDVRTSQKPQSRPTEKPAFIPPKPQTIFQPRRKDAAWEGSQVYVPQRTHRDFVDLRHGNEAELLQWYPVVALEWSEGIHKDDNPGSDMIRFWKTRYDERWPPKEIKPARSSGPIVPSAAETRKKYLNS